jgi:hypothetical protein
MSGVGSSAHDSLGELVMEQREGSMEVLGDVMRASVWLGFLSSRPARKTFPTFRAARVVFVV